MNTLKKSIVNFGLGPIFIVLLISSALFLYYQFAPKVRLMTNYALWRYQEPSSYYLRVTESRANGVWQAEACIKDGTLQSSRHISDTQQQNRQFYEDRLAINNLTIDNLFALTRAFCADRGFLNCGIGFSQKYHYPMEITSYEIMLLTVEEFLPCGKNFEHCPLKCKNVNPETPPNISPVVEITSTADVETSIGPSSHPSVTVKSSLPQLSFPQGLSYGEIAYLSDRTGTTEIWLLNLTTGVEKQLTETVCDDVFVSGYFPEWEWFGVQGFTWSPNGQHIAYLTKCKDAAWAHLWVYNLTTESTTLITDQADDNSYPSWSPSNNELVFTISSLKTVYITDVEKLGEPESKLVTNTLSAFPTWSPDGEYIAYRGPRIGTPSYSATTNRTYISIVDTKWRDLEYAPPSSELSDIRDRWLAAPVDGGLVWSHHGQYLAVATVREAVPGWISLITIEDQVACRCSGSLVSLDSNPFGRDFYNPVFSPDDETLYFVSVMPGSEFGFRFGTIYRVSVQDMLHGHSSFDIPFAPVSPEDQLAGFPALSSDGKWLVYAIRAGKATDLWVQTIGDAHRQPLIENGYMNTQPSWRPTKDY